MAPDGKAMDDEGPRINSDLYGTMEAIQSWKGSTQERVVPLKANPKLPYSVYVVASKYFINWG